jgi:hypothetical protein
VFHPKVYLIKKRNTYVAFVGSANCTNGGLNSNIELSLCIDNQNTCTEIKRWFEKHMGDAIALSSSFLKDYELDYKKKKQDYERAKSLLEKQYRTLGKHNLISQLKDFKDGNDYEHTIQERKDDMVILKKLLNNYKNDNFFDKNGDFYRFLNKRALGGMTLFNKNEIFASTNTAKIQQIISICESGGKKDIEEVYNEATSIDADGISYGTIAKILTTLYPNRYFNFNKGIKDVCESFGINLDIENGKDYKDMCKEFNAIKNDVDFDDFAILDIAIYSLKKTTKELNNDKRAV